MYHRGVVVEMGNAKVNDLFDEPRVGEVTYVNLSGDSRTKRPPAPNPFLKNLMFADQREVRIVFYPRRAIALETLTIKIPRPRQLFEEMALPIEGRGPIESATASSCASLPP